MFISDKNRRLQNSQYAHETFFSQKMHHWSARFDVFKKFYLQLEYFEVFCAILWNSFVIVSIDTKANLHSISFLMSYFKGIRVMVFNVAFNNISYTSWRSDILVEETGVLGENHRPVVSHWQPLSHNVA